MQISHTTPHEHNQQQHCICCETKLQQPLFCHGCQRIQQLKEGANYFSIFAHPTQFDIDHKHIDRFYDELLLALHPDYYAQSNPTDQILSMEHTTLLNDAKETLSDPFKRGKYLLSLLCPLNGSLDVSPPQSFIMKMFELQEVIDDIESGEEDQSVTDLEVENLIENVHQELVQLFCQLSELKEDETTVVTIKENLGKYKFLLNLKERLQHIN